MTFEDYLLKTIKEEYTIILAEKDMEITDEIIQDAYNRVINDKDINHYKQEWISEQRKSKLKRIV